MAIGTVQVFPLVIASGTSTSAEVDLGRGFWKVNFDPTGALGSTSFFGARVSGGTYRQVRHPVASGMSAPQTMTVGSAMSGSIVEVAPVAGLRFVKVAADATITNGATLYLYCSDV